MSTDEIRSEVEALVTGDPDEAARLLLWLVLDRQVREVSLAAERHRADEANKEAHRLRLLWNSAAACLANLTKPPKPRGGDERRMLAHVHTAHGPISAGTTDGWLDWLPDPAAEEASGRRKEPAPTPGASTDLTLFPAPGGGT